MARTAPTKAFTLIESLTASVVLSIAVLAVLLPFSAGARSQLFEARQTLAVQLAEELMEEILQRSFEEPDDDDEAIEPAGAFGPELGETSRADFDAVDDYHGLVEPAGAIVGPDGAVVTDPLADGLSRHVYVTYVYVYGQDAGDDPSVMRVVVEIRHDGEPLITLTRLVHWLD